MFEEKEGVADEPLFASRDNLFLEGQTLRIGDPAEMEEVDVHV